MVAKTYPQQHTSNEGVFSPQLSSLTTTGGGQNAGAPLFGANPFWYIRLTDATFCGLLERSAHVAATDYESAIRTRLSRFAPWLVEYVAGITETPLQGVWQVTFAGGVSRAALRAIDTSGLLKTVGCYQTGQGSWQIAVRLVRHD